MTKVGIMGGTFDPVHIGHLIAAETAQEACGLDQVWFIPTADPPLKASAPKASAELRYEMTAAAVEGNSRFDVLDIELRRGGVSYSLDTVGQLKQLYPDHSFYYIIGSDRVNDLTGWHRIEELARRIRFIGLRRSGEEPRPDKLPDWLRERLELVEMPAIGVSSTDIRARAEAGRSVRYLMPEPAYRIMRRHGLYGSAIDH